MDSAASAPVVGKKLACRMGIWKRARKISVKQGDGSSLIGGNFIVNSSFKVFDSSHALLGKFSLDAEVLDIGKKDCILGLSWLVENGFSIDVEARCLSKCYYGFGYTLFCSLYSSCYCYRS